VVLGGAIEQAIAPVRPASELNEAAERITVIAELARKYQSARILYSGGNGSPVPGGGSEAQIAAALFETFGVPARRLILEDQSRTTAENAAFSRRLVMPKPGERWLLVRFHHEVAGLALAHDARIATLYRRLASHSEASLRSSPVSP